MVKEEAERNMERLARKERIVKREGKMLMERSQPPKLVTKRVKVEMD